MINASLKTLSSSSYNLLLVRSIWRKIRKASAIIYLTVSALSPTSNRWPAVTLDYREPAPRETILELAMF